MPSALNVLKESIFCNIKKKNAITLNIFCSLGDDRLKVNEFLLEQNVLSFSIVFRESIDQVFTSFILFYPNRSKGVETTPG